MKHLCTFFLILISSLQFQPFRWHWLLINLFLRLSICVHLFLSSPKYLTPIFFFTISHSFKPFWCKNFQDILWLKEHLGEKKKTLQKHVYTHKKRKKKRVARVYTLSRQENISFFFLSFHFFTSFFLLELSNRKQYKLDGCYMYSGY